MRHFHRSDEKQIQSCKRAIGDAKTAEPKFIAFVTISAESELIVEDRGKGDVLPVKRPVPVARIGLLGQHLFVLEGCIREIACVTTLLPQCILVNVQEPSMPT